MEYMMDDKIKLNEYYYDFLEYYRKAKVLQNNCNLGGQSFTGQVNDDLMEQVHIFDTVERQHAGFQNMLQDLWFGSSAPKHYKWQRLHKERNVSYDDQHKVWTRREWLWIFLFHRITGSGASFEADHGYRNSVIPELAKLRTCEDMVEWVRNNDSTPMFTSIGNQIPMFPSKYLWESLNKSGFEYKTPGKLWLCECMTDLVDDTWKAIDININLGARVGIRDIVDYMCDWNRARGIKRFHFQFTATAADLADYYPDMVDPISHMYYGKNAKEAMDMFAEKIGRYKKAFYYDHVMEAASKDTAGAPRDLEDVMCDYIRYVENYIPSSKQKTYDHLDRETVWNTSSMVNHPKGRQKWKLNTDLWEW
jgi:hypothetical protein